MIFNCLPITRSRGAAPAAVNPTALFEVLSDGTEAYDRTEKVTHYRRIPALREYVLVSHRERRIERHARAADGEWRVEAAGSGEVCAVDKAGGYLEYLADEARSQSIANITVLNADADRGIG